MYVTDNVNSCSFLLTSSLSWLSSLRKLPNFKSQLQEVSSLWEEYWGGWWWLLHLWFGVPLSIRSAMVLNPDKGKNPPAERYRGLVCERSAVKLLLPVLHAAAGSIRSGNEGASRSCDLRGLLSNNRGLAGKYKPTVGTDVIFDTRVTAYPSMRRGSTSSRKALTTVLSRVN